VHELSTLMPSPGVDGCESPQQSFDFSGFANLQEVNFVFTVGRTGGGLLWISKVLSTLRPTTSPRLSAVQLNFSDPPTDLSIKTLIKNTANDLRRVASEVSRIEREFEGVVKFTVLRDSVFGAVLCALNVSIRFSGWGRPHVDSPSSVPCRSFSTIPVEMRSVVTSPTCLSPTGRTAASNRLVLHAADRFARILASTYRIFHVHAVGTLESIVNQ